MNSNGQKNVKLHFGVFDVDEAAGELRHSGTRIKIQPQPFRALSLLLERPGEVISREEMKAELAPGLGFGDFDHTINVAVAKLRQALGDSCIHPIYIETLPRRGYRFVYPVGGNSAGSASDARAAAAGFEEENRFSVGVEAAPASARRSPPVGGLVTAALFLAVSSGGLAWWRSSRQPRSGEAKKSDGGTSG